MSEGTQPPRSGPQTASMALPRPGWFERAAVWTISLLGATLEPRAIKVIRDLYSNMVVMVVFLLCIHFGHKLLKLLLEVDITFWSVPTSVIVKYIEVSLYILVVAFGSLKGLLAYFFGKEH